MNERYVLLGLAHPRAPWFGEVARWATAGAAPLDFTKCVSSEEVRARLSSGRVVSALVADADRIANDRDLVDQATSAGCAVLVVDDGRLPRDWQALGVSAALLPGFDREELLATLATHARAVGRVIDGPTAERRAAVGQPDAWRGRLIAVTGCGGTGASTLAMAIAQGSANDARNRGLVVLADFALDADLAMLHDARDVVPGLQELVEASRSGAAVDEVARVVYRVEDRGYDLLLGLRRHRDWTAIRPRAFEGALDALRRGYRVAVADVDADIEGEDETGSIDVAERNHIARHTLRHADVVAVVGGPSMKGIHSLARTLRDLRAGGVEPARLVPVVNRVGRSPRTRAELTRTLVALGGLEGAHVASPIYVGERRGLDDGLVHAAPLPSALTSVAAAITALLDRSSAPTTPIAREPVAVVPGSLGSWRVDDGELGEPGGAA